MSTPTPTPVCTYTYRVYHYRNGLDEDSFQAKEKGKWFGWNNIRFNDMYPTSLNLSLMFENPVMSWRTREGMVQDLSKYSKRKIEAIIAAGLADKRSKMELILVQDIDL